MKSVLRKPVGSSRGFTLLELMVVLALLAIFGMLLAGMDTAGWIAHYRLQGAAKELYMNMQKVRMNALKENKDWAIVFEAGANRYQLCSDNGADDDWTTLGDNTIFETIDLAGYGSGIGFGHGSATKNISGGTTFPAGDISFSDDVIIFDSQGRSKTGARGDVIGTGYCYLSNTQNSTYVIGKATVPGSIRMLRWNGKAWE